MSWLTDPDGEWSSEDDPAQRPGGAGHLAEPVNPAGHPDPNYPDPNYPDPRHGDPNYSGQAYYNPGNPGQAYPGQGGYPEPEPAYPAAGGPGYTYGQDPAGYRDFDEYAEDEPRSRFRLIAIIVAAWFVVSVLVLGFLLLTHGPKKATTAAGSTGTSSAATSPSPSGSTDSSLPAGWVQRDTDDQTNCAAHSYGQVAAFFGKSPCSSVHRVLATTTASGRPVVIASYTVIFTTADAAAKYNVLVASDGTGNINDLLREGATYPGAPVRLPDAAFASKQQGQRVLVAEAGFATGTSNPADASLKALAQQSVNAG